jgi:hypothetical protein
VAELVSRRARKICERGALDSHFEAGKRKPTKEHLAAMKAALQRGGISFLDAEKSRGIAVLK